MLVPQLPLLAITEQLILKSQVLAKINYRCDGMYTIKAAIKLVHKSFSVMLLCSAIFYRVDSLTLTVVRKQILFCNASITVKPEEDHKTVIETLQNKLCLQTTVKVKESTL